MRPAVAAGEVGHDDGVALRPRAWRETRAPPAGAGRAELTMLRLLFQDAGDGAAARSCPHPVSFFSLPLDGGWTGDGLRTQQSG